MQVTETMNLRAPFFGYATIDSWTEYPLPHSVQTIAQLEAFLEQTTTNYPRPYFFKLTAVADTAVVHLVNLPRGTRVSSPEEAHKGQRNFDITNTEVLLLGFFSTEHKTIFTHHDTYVHLHLLTADKRSMGHLEQLRIRKGTAKLFLPSR
jgi:acetolactate decarboxylase